MWIVDGGCPGVRVVEGPIKPGPNTVFLALEPGVRLCLAGPTLPWTTAPPSPALLARAAMSETLTKEVSRSAVMEGQDGYTLAENGERVLAVRLHEKCSHPQDQWARRPCGHCWCKLCQGWVHLGTQVVLKGAHGVIANNRLWHRFNDYEFLFRETGAR